MVLIRYRQANGDVSEVQADVGTSVMEAAVNAGIEGIDADCGGQLSCATCHVYVDIDWHPKLAEMSSEERCPSSEHSAQLAA
ncbi:2Fe-2S iron-sulfur cluster-binding protein [Sphingopyxis granuli]|uniref:2Fe-2S iron-sulfur cluster-binding protein n=1 Tax=Sphingopyxis granuli TaxID=267128 RepID=UPI001F52B892|nr:2Fe-2S iron-sulfur cluster-binding protein [Sphingopyxis granuli]UNK81079.1 2Fe-2S iron-sulfur cluster-binding protein [Sphingopyxis granuli]